MMRYLKRPPPPPLQLVILKKATPPPPPPNFFPVSKMIWLRDMKTVLLGLLNLLIGKADSTYRDMARPPSGTFRNL